MKMNMKMTKSMKMKTTANSMNHAVPVFFAARWRRKRLAEKFINPMGRQTDAALFSGKRMDDDEEITYTARGVAADPDDVLFSGNRATQPEYDEYDPLLNGAPITEPVAVAAAATTATQSWAAPVEPVTQTPPVASVDVPPSQPTVAAACTGSTNGRAGYCSCTGRLPTAVTICTACSAI